MSVVLGYDESPGSRRALSVAISMASLLEEQLVLVYGVAPPGGASEEWRSHRDALADQARSVINHAVADAEAAGLSPVVELVDQQPAQALVAVADRHDARMIIVGTWGESPLRGAIVGSTPHKLLHLSRRPVLCVPADAAT